MSERRASFEAVADLYAAVRRGYPAALYDDLHVLAGLGGASRVLEVGCGAGQATADLAARAGRVTAIDPGERLIGQARARVGGAPVDFELTGLEAYDPEPGRFDLVAAAQAWHWIPHEIAFAKAALALRGGGALAIWGHVPLMQPQPFASAFERIYNRHAPGIWGLPPPQSAYLPSGPFPGQFAASGLFGPVEHRTYPWTWRLDPPTLGAYLRTDSAYHFLPEDRRFALFDDLTAAVADLGGVMEAPWETHLYLARKA